MDGELGDVADDGLVGEEPPICHHTLGENGDGLDAGSLEGGRGED